MELKILSEEELNNGKYNGFKFDLDDIKYLLEDQAKLTVNQIVEWGNEPCDKHNIIPCPEEIGGGVMIRKGMKRRRCPKCWRELEKD